MPAFLKDIFYDNDLNTLISFFKIENKISQDFSDKRAFVEYQVVRIPFNYLTENFFFIFIDSFDNKLFVMGH